MEPIPTIFEVVASLMKPPFVFTKVQSDDPLAPAVAAAQERLPEPSVCKKLPATIDEGQVYVLLLSLVVPTTERLLPTFRLLPVLRIPAKVELAEAERPVKEEKPPAEIPPANVEVAELVAMILENSLYPDDVKFLVAREPRKVEVAVVEVALRERKLGVIESTSLNW